MINNSARHGGGIDSVNSELYVLESKFYDNDATWYGGAIHSILSKLTIINSEFEGNGGHYGGAVSGIRSWVEASSIDFRENTAEIGGAVYAEDAEIKLQFRRHPKPRHHKASGHGSSACRRAR